MIHFESSAFVVYDSIPGTTAREDGENEGKVEEKDAEAMYTTKPAKPSQGMDSILCSTHNEHVQVYMKSEYTGHGGLVSWRVAQYSIALTLWLSFKQCARSAVSHQKTLEEFYRRIGASVPVCCIT